jgi:hypothetical protein
MSLAGALKAREIPWIITLVSAFITIIAWFLVSQEAQDVSSALQVWVVILGGFAVAGLGPLAILIFHTARIRQRKEGQWPFSAWLLIIMVVTIITGVFIQPLAANDAFLWLYNTLYLPANATVYALLAFWIISAAFRAFRVRTWEAAVLFAAAILMIFRNAPFGAAIWPGFGDIGGWIMDIPTGAAFRGIIIASAIGVIALSIRILLGYERSAGGGT